jgi:glutamine synthetase
MHTLIPAMATRDGKPWAIFGTMGGDGQAQLQTQVVINLVDHRLEPEEAVKIKSTPGSLGEVLDALEGDHEFLLAGDVFTTGLIESYIGYKREREVDAIALRPHPYEFHLYYDA